MVFIKKSCMLYKCCVCTHMLLSIFPMHSIIVELICNWRFLNENNCEKQKIIYNFIMYIMYSMYCAVEPWPIPGDNHGIISPSSDSWVPTWLYRWRHFPILSSLMLHFRSKADFQGDTVITSELPAHVWLAIWGDRHHTWSWPCSDERTGFPVLVYRQYDGTLAFGMISCNGLPLPWGYPKNDFVCAVKMRLYYQPVTAT